MIGGFSIGLFNSSPSKVNQVLRDFSKLLNLYDVKGVLARKSNYSHSKHVQTIATLLGSNVTPQHNVGF
jgi:hypothetical protein